MPRRNPATLQRALLMVGDWLLVVASSWLAYYVRFGTGWIPAHKGVPPWIEFAGASVLIAALWLWALHWAGVYANRNSPSAVDEVYRILVGVAVGSLLAGATTFLTHALWYPRLVLSLSAACAALAVTAWHLALRRLYRRLHQRGIGRQRIALVAAGTEARALAERLQELAPSHEVVGFLSPGGPSESGETPSPGLPELGAADDLSLLAEAQQLDELWVAPFSTSPSATLRLLGDAEAAGLTVRLLPDLLDLIKHRGALESCQGMQLIAVRYARLTGGAFVVKRLLDLLGATCLLILLSPVMLVAALLVRLTSPGPALFGQERVGKDGKHFTMLKFRTMRDDAESDTGPVWAVEDDPRCTRVGAFLRRTSLDETPQILNVLRGEMSLAGPRPERPHFVEKFRRQIPRYDDRHRVKGGITGWAQVHGLRGNTSVVERTVYDLHYVENWSLALDLEILVKTAFEFLFHKTAY